MEKQVIDDGLKRCTANTIVEPARLMHRHPVTPYAGAELLGVVEKTFVRGELVFDGEPATRPSGQWV